MPGQKSKMNICTTVGELIGALSEFDLTMRLDCGGGYRPVVVPDPTAPGEVETLRLDDEFARMS